MRRGLVRRTAAICLIVLLGGFVGGWWASDQLTQAGRWRPDGAAPDTFWTHSNLDVPGLYVGDEHCHGQVRRLVEIGITGQAPNDACGYRYSAYTDLLDLPFGLAVVRRTNNGSAWRYGIEGQPQRIMPPLP